MCASLEPAIRAAVQRLLSPTDPEIDDMVQDTLVAMLGYLQRAKQVPDNPEAFAVTIARNRCINLHLWRRRRVAQDIDAMADKIPQAALSPLELISNQQRQELVTEALEHLDEACRKLLIAIYRKQSSIEEIRRWLGLKSVQAVYYRRNACIEKAQKFLNRRLFDCRPVADTPPPILPPKMVGKEREHE